MDLSKLVGGEALTLPCTINKNGLGIKTHVLIDTGANGFIFIDSELANLAIQHLGAELKELPTPCAINGFDGKTAPPITQYLELSLFIDRTRQQRLPMLVVRLGGHDLIIGRTWIDRYNILVDCRNRQLIWPDEPLESPSWSKIIATHKKALLPGPVDQEHQRDADRRDRLLDRDWQPRILRQTQAGDQQRDYQAMAKALQTTRKAPVAVPKLALIDICAISGVAFCSNLKRQGNEFFKTSLYEIDRILEERQELIKEAQKTEDQQPGETETQWLQRLLPKQYYEYIDVFSREASDRLPPHRPYDHKIRLDTPNGAERLGYSPLYHQSTAELEAVKQYLIENLDKGFINTSQAPFAAPILFVKKPNGSLRFCIDYRKLNSLTRKDRYPLPLIEETLARLAKAKIFTKLDIRQAFHRIRMDPESEELTTFRTRYGAYKCKVLPFGLTNGPATYQRYMNDVLFEYLDVFYTAYLDDILIYSEDPLEHETHVKKVLDRLRTAGLQADIKKSEFSVTRTKYLGFIVSTDGVATDPEKVEVVRNWQRPATVKSIQSFLGFCNFYRRFIRDYGRIARPLNFLTRKDTPFIWDKSCQGAFEQLKEAMLSAPVL